MLQSVFFAQERPLESINLTIHRKGTRTILHAMSSNLYLPMGLVLNRIEFEIGDDPATFWP